MGATLVIANPASGGARGRRLGEAAVRSEGEAGRDARLLLTRGAGDARGATEAFVAGGGRRVVVCGGDGTIHEVAGALAGTAATLGILPCGRGNDFARALGLPREPGAALAVLAAGGLRRVDLGRVGRTAFATVASAGLDAVVGRRVHAGGRRLGVAAYALAFLRTAGTYRCPEVRIEGDFGVFEGRLLLVAAGNTGFYGGGMNILPEADSADGLLDVCIVPEAPTATILRIFPGVFRGRHVRHPLVRMERTRSLRIESEEAVPLIADGEPAGEVPVTLGVDPGALSVVVPRERAAES